MLEEFGLRLQKARKRRGYTQRELAEKADVSYSSLRLYEKIMDSNSKSKPPIDAVISLANCLDVSLDYLCNGSEIKIKEGSAIPAIRSLIDVIEFFGFGVDLTNDFVLYLTNGDYESNQILKQALGQYMKLKECGLKEIDGELFDQTVDTLLMRWKDYYVCKGGYFSEGIESFLPLDEIPF